MWSLIKTLFSLAVIGAVAYAILFVPVGGATLAQHGQDVWKSTTVQDKVHKVKSGLKDELGQRVAPAVSTAAKAKPARVAPTTEISDSDRQALNDLLTTSLRK